MRLRSALCALTLALPATFLPAQTTQTPPAATAATVVPALIHYAGTALHTDGKPQTGEASTTFTIFRDETGGNPLWIETQLIAFDPTGRYEAHLGATSPDGLPSNLFSGGDARWLEVQVAGVAPQPRILLVSVPYALKAADAATLNGLPASAFALKADAPTTTPSSLATVSPETSASAVTTTGGTAGYLPVFNGPTTIADSDLFQSTTGYIGIGTATPGGPLQVSTGAVGGANATMMLTQTSAAAGNYYANIGLYNSNGLIGNLSALGAGYPAGNLFGANDVVFLGGQQKASTNLIMLTNTSGAIKFGTGGFGIPNERFRIGAAGGLSVGNTFVNTDPGAGNLIVSGNVGIATPTPTANLEVNGTAKFDGLVTFASTQTFPGTGSGTITAITTSSPLTGSGTKGSVALSLSLPALETSLNTQYAQLAAPNTFTAPITFAAGQTFPGTGPGTITGITTGSGLKGGGTSGALTLSLDPAVVPTLTGSPYFNGSSGTGIIASTTGVYGYTAGVLGYAGTRTSNQAITGVWGDAANHDGVTGTSTTLVGVHGISATGSGVVGTSNGTQLNTAGVLGTVGNRTSFSGIAAVWGDADAHAGVFGSSNQYSGVIGQSTSGPGVYGSSVSGYGAQFTAAGINAAVYATNTTAAGGNGIFATSTGTDSNTIYANSTGGGSAAIYGIATGGSDTNGTPSTGVVGYSSSGSGVYGTTTGNVLQTAGTLGVAGYRTSFAGIAGVWGDASTHVGTIGTSDQYAGVQGQSTNSFGVQGISPNYVGVFGVGGSSDPGIFTNINVKGSQIGAWGDVSGDPLTPGDVPIAVVGTATNGIGGYFQNNSEIDTVTAFNYDGNNVQRLFKTFKAASPDGICGFGSGGDLTCTGQIKALASTSNGTRTVETYSVQSPENWMEDFGAGSLTNGSTTITIDPSFADTDSQSADYHVFLTPNGDSKGLYIAQKSPTSFTVRESGSGRSSISFDYRIVAKRRGLEAQRMVDVTDRFKAEQKNTPMDKLSNPSTFAKAPR
jgi:hypothetical protein